MANLALTVERKAFSVAIDAALKSLNKDREKGLLQIVDLTEKFMGDNFRKEAYDGVRKMIQNPDHKWMRYVNRLLDETDPHVAKMTALNLGFQAAFYGTKTIRKMREVHDCNIPWLILMDPTSACNLHCTGCWAAEYGNKLNLSFDELDSIVTQGKELGIYFYMMTGGEPLVRKADIIKLCEKHNDCAFHCYTNGTLVDQKLCDDMKRVGNLSLSISLEGFEDANDFRRGEGVYDKVLRNYCHINPKGDVEPCVFIHYSGANIREKSLLECLKQPLFMAYRDNQPFNDNMLRPCPMLENPEILQRMVHETGAHSTDVEEAEPVEHLCGKCEAYACEWKETADRLWKEHPYKQKGYHNSKNN